MDLKALARELHADERAELLAHLLALGAEDRRLRFEYSMSDDGVRRYVEGIDFSHDAVFVVTDADLTIVGAAQLARKDMLAELGESDSSRTWGTENGRALPVS